MAGIAVRVKFPSRRVLLVLVKRIVKIPEARHPVIVVTGRWEPGPGRPASREGGYTGMYRRHIVKMMPERTGDESGVGLLLCP
eukprot:SAG31_NODE_15384_length_757_cov_4.480243_1_plen_82_part_10